MAFVKYATAQVVKPHVSRNEWSHVRTAAKAKNSLNENLIARASELFNAEFDPEKYLLTHATIVASVDVYNPPGIKTGSVLEDGFRVNRRYADFRVKPATDKYLNNNLDGWSRPVLLKSYPTFIGGHSFVEHVQIEEMSKGRIIDAVARDIGDSVYIDILIADDRKHKDLIAAIESGKLGTLSMGCTVDGTVCTKCGHWAADESELCPHIKYAKGNTFFDEQGRQHRIAELCGHETIDPHGGVQFIEASWVASPAFTGAVLRNILEPTEEIAKKAQAILSIPPPEWSQDAMLKAASVVQGQGQEIKKIKNSACQSAIITANSFLKGWDESGGEAPIEDAPPAEPKEDGLLDTLEKDLLDAVKMRVKKKLQDELKGPEPSPEDTSSTNENLNKVASVYVKSIETLVKIAKSDVELINFIADFNNNLNIKIPISLYRVALAVGPHRRYAGMSAYKEACEKMLKHPVTLPEARVLIRLGKLLSQRDILGSTKVINKKED
jgi:hypothetical protein